MFVARPRTVKKSLPTRPHISDINAWRGRQTSFTLHLGRPRAFTKIRKHYRRILKIYFFTPTDTKEGEIYLRWIADLWSDLQQVIARRDDMPPSIAADLRPCADGSAVRTALVAWPRRCTPSWPRCDRQTDRQTDGRTDGSRHRIMTPNAGGA